MKMEKNIIYQKTSTSRMLRASMDTHLNTNRESIQTISDIGGRPELRACNVSVNM